MMQSLCDSAGRFLHDEPHVALFDDFTCFSTDAHAVTQIAHTAIAHARAHTLVAFGSMATV